MKYVIATALMLLEIVSISNAQSTVSDADGNAYKTVKIGNQIWMAENLKTTKYRNGDPIATTNPATRDISGEVKPKYQWAYRGDEANAAVYGRLYTLHVVADSRGLSPAGWHVATAADWAALTKFLGGESVAGGKLKEAGADHWIAPNVDATNESHFTALPGGGRLSDGPFNDLGSGGIWWTASGSGVYLNYSDGRTHGFGFVPSSGLAVRCVKDSVQPKQGKKKK